MYRFFSAYEVLNQLEKDYQSNQSDIIEKATEMASQESRGQGRGRGRGRGRGSGRGGRGSGQTGNKLPDEVKFDEVSILILFFE